MGDPAWTKNPKRSINIKGISKIAAIGLLILVCIVIAVGAYYALFVLSLNGSPTEPTEPTETQKLPDLKVRDMFVYPSQSVAGTYFSVQVNVENIGEAKSGSYDLAVWIHDVSRDSNYPVGTFRLGPLNPNYQQPWSSGKLMVNYAGSHQLWAEIIPFDFEDGDDSNNMSGWQFRTLDIPP